MFDPQYPVGHWKNPRPLEEWEITVDNLLDSTLDYIRTQDQVYPEAVLVETCDLLDYCEQHGTQARVQRLGMSIASAALRRYTRDIDVDLSHGLTMLYTAQRVYELAGMSERWTSWMLGCHYSSTIDSVLDKFSQFPHEVTEIQRFFAPHIADEPDLHERLY